MSVKDGQKGLHEGDPASHTNDKHGMKMTSPDNQP